jgi:protein gp37
MQISRLKIKKPFSNLFGIDAVTLSVITEDMQTRGYDASKPLDIWRDTIVDGHTRVKAAISVGISDVPVYKHNFKNEDEALEYAIHNQRNRRNLTQAEIIRCIEAVDKRRKRGGNNKAKAPRDAKTATKTASVVGVSPRTVERARTVLDHGDEETKRQMKKGEIPVRKAFELTQEKRKHENIKGKAKFNITNENIEWAKYSWNPVVGCKHGCKYCYARDIANRFYGNFKPRFIPERLSAPENTKPMKGVMSNVFVCSMADLFGDWVPQDWINAVMDACRENTAWNYLFLTKNPKRMKGVDFPENAWAGITIDTQKRLDTILPVFNNTKIKVQTRFISCEPLLEPLNFKKHLHNIDWIIIGSQSESTQAPAKQPEWEWVEDILIQARKVNAMVYFKPNLTVRPKEYPRNV